MRSGCDAAAGVIFFEQQRMPEWQSVLHDYAASTRSFVVGVTQARQPENFSDDLIAHTSRRGGFSYAAESAMVGAPIIG